MLAGSIGLDTVAARLNIADAINDLRIVKLDAFDEPTADAFLIALSEAHTVNLDEAVRQHIVRRIGWPVPFYLQLIFHELRNAAIAVTATHVDQAIASLLSPYNRNYFDYWRQRLHEELGEPDAGNACSILNHCCRSASGSPRDALSLALVAKVSDARQREDTVRYLLDVLQNDGYLVETQGRIGFRSPLLREYWMRRVAPPEELDAAAR